MSSKERSWRAWASGGLALAGIAVMGFSAWAMFTAPEQGRPQVLVTPVEAAPASQASGQGYRAFLDEDGNLTSNPTPEQLQATGLKSRPEPGPIVPNESGVGFAQATNGAFDSVMVAHKDEHGNVTQDCSQLNHIHEAAANSTKEEE